MKKLWKKIRRNKTLKKHLKSILKAIKTFFRQLLLIGKELTKTITTIEIKDNFDDKQFTTNEVYDISKETTKEDELFDYVGIPSYYKTDKNNHNDKDIYIKKEQEIKLQITDIENKITELLNLKNTNNDVSNKIKEMEKIMNAPILIKEFDKEIFDSIVERIILGEIDENGNSNPNVVRFILKTGKEYKCENNGIDTSVSFGSYKRFSQII